jgi:hypothetical protein
MNIVVKVIRTVNANGSINAGEAIGTRAVTTIRTMSVVKAIGTDRATIGTMIVVKAKGSGRAIRMRIVTMNQQAVLDDDQAVLGLFDKYCEL